MRAVNMRVVMSWAVGGGTFKNVAGTIPAKSNGKVKSQQLPAPDTR